jgi:hypothetical protein
MKIVSAVVIGFLAAAVLTPASAGTAEKGIGFTVPQNTEFSASKKYRRAYWPVYHADPYYRPYHHVVPSHDFIGGPDGYPGEYAARKSYGQCVLDLGYGRWRAC